MSASDSFLNAVASRRTIYGLSHESPISDARIKEITEQVIRNVPSAFNMQSARIIVLLGKEHEKLWDTITEVYKVFLPAEKFESAKGRFIGFRAGYGTALFYEDTVKVREFQEKFKTYHAQFPSWSEQANGMNQFALWTALELEGFGVNLQHYNPVIDKRLEHDYDLPETWSLKSQMVFGKPTGGPMDKTIDPLENRLKVFGA